jgi:hypothetical protein
VQGAVSDRGTSFVIHSSNGKSAKRRVGWFYYSGGIVGFTQRNAQFTLASPRVLAWDRIANCIFVERFVPPSAGLVRGLMFTNNNSVTVYDNSTNVILSISAAPAAANTWPFDFVVQNAALQMSYDSSSASGQVSIRGWDDTI